MKTVSVDSEGDVWATLRDSDQVIRIRPDALGSMQSTVDNPIDLGPGAYTYNYSDMTGLQALGTLARGTWTMQWDTNHQLVALDSISWAADEPQGTEIIVEVRPHNANDLNNQQSFISI